MAKNFERELPDGYKESLVIDATNKKLGIFLNLIAIVIAVIVVVIAVFVIKPKFKEFNFIHLITLSLGLLAYVVAHELAHGIAYKLLTREKLKFGMTLTVAFCGVPNIYVYRKTAMIALLSPFILFTLIFGGLMIFLPNSIFQFIFAILFGFHLGGCSGDLYNVFLYLFKFKDNDTLMQDTGPKQTFYVKSK